MSGRSSSWSVDDFLLSAWFRHPNQPRRRLDPNLWGSLSSFGAAKSASGSGLKCHKVSDPISGLASRQAAGGGRLQSDSMLILCEPQRIGGDGWPLGGGRASRRRAPASGRAAEPRGEMIDRRRDPIWRRPLNLNGRFGRPAQAERLTSGPSWGRLLDKCGPAGDGSRVRVAPRASPRRRPARRRAPHDNKHLHPHRCPSCRPRAVCLVSRPEVGGSLARDETSRAERMKPGPGPGLDNSLATY